MNIEFKKRFLAYLIDLLIVGLLLGIIVAVKEKDEKLMQLRSEFDIVEELYINKEIGKSDYFERSSLITQNIEQECVIYTIFNIIFVVGYFIILPHYWNGQTLGKRIVKIKVVSSSEHKITIANYLIRNTIINGLGYMILMLLILYLLPSKMYFLFSSIFSFIQLILVIISVSMILYRKDKRGLHDILGGTKVVSLLEA